MFRGESFLSTPPSSMVRCPATANGHGRNATAPPGRGHRGAAGSRARPAPGGAALREPIDRLAGCEAMTDRSIARPESAQER
jgi:hypothetical protein